MRKAFVCAIAIGCAATPEAPEADQPGIDSSRGPADPDAYLGGFVVDLLAARDTTPAHTAVIGKVYDGPVPSTVVWRVVQEETGCRLLTPRAPFCSPGCGGSAVCVEDGRCQPYPTAQNLGRVRVSGLGGSAFDMDPIAGSYQPAAGVSLPYPPFQEGSAVQMTTSGADLPSFTLASQGISPLDVESSFALASEQALSLVWTPPANPTGSRIEVTLNISLHGGSNGKIECSGSDGGSLTIPAAQISSLLALGVAGFPTIVITRVASGMTGLARGRVTLRVTSTLERAVQIPGLQSCTSPDDCPAGQTCRANLSCG
jgi:hypothetical protein